MPRLQRFRRCCPPSDLRRRWAIFEPSEAVISEASPIDRADRDFMTAMVILGLTRASE